MLPVSPFPSSGFSSQLLSIFAGLGDLSMYGETTISIASKHKSRFLVNATGSILKYFSLSSQYLKTILTSYQYSRSGFAGSLAVCVLASTVLRFAFSTGSSPRYLQNLRFHIGWRNFDIGEWAVI
jgi:hypothetical protein